MKLRIDVMLRVLSKLGKCGRTRLMKLLYLIDRELVLNGYKPLFSWMLWWYGPFSREVLDLLDALEAIGLVRSMNSKRGKIYIAEVKEHILSDKKIQDIVDKVVHEWGDKKLQNLLRYVYSLDEVKKAHPLKAIDLTKLCQH
ncbi:MAG: SocA family protein [Crenarchaeota archaeon]|nr:SocA family protein [Thermoproteota archaeon]